MSNNKESIHYNNAENSYIDPNWIVFSDESLLFDDKLVLFKYFDNCDQNFYYDIDFLEEFDDYQQIDDEILLLYHFSKLSSDERMDYLNTIIRKNQMNMKRSCEDLISSAALHHSMFKKRLYMMKKYQTILDFLKVNMKEKKEDLLLKKELKDNIVSNVPVVVKLSVVMLLPLIKTLSTIHEEESQLICSQSLDMMIGILKTMNPLSMKNEPEECLDSYKEFFSYLIESNDKDIDISVKMKAIIALILLSVAIGRPSNIFKSINILLDMLMNPDFTEKVNIDTKLIQIDRILNLDKMKFDIPLINDCYDSSFQIELFKYMQMDSKNMPYKPSITTDGNFVYVLNNFGLFKIGTGLNGTIKGLIYKMNTEIKKTFMTSVACIGETLYLLEREKDKSNEGILDIKKISTKDLNRLGEIYLRDYSFSNNLELIGNGEYLYLVDVNKFVLCRNGNFQSEIDIKYTTNILDDTYINDTEMNDNNMIMVQVYDPAITDQFIEPIRNFNVFCQISSHYVLYCTKKYFVVNTCEEDSETTFITFFSLSQCKSKIIKLKTGFENTIPCYDVKNNILWTIDPSLNCIQSWINQELSHNEDSAEDYFTSENIFKSISNENQMTRSFFEDQILKFLCSLEKLSKIHPSFKINDIAGDHPKSVFEESHLFKLFIEMNDTYIEYISLTLKNSLNYIRKFKNWQDKSVYIIVATLRILKINLVEIISNHIQISKNLLDDLRNTLFSLINDKNNNSKFFSFVQNLAMDVIIVGFKYFFKEPEEKLNICIEMLKQSENEDNIFLQKLLKALSKCKYSCENLTGLDIALSKDSMNIEYTNEDFLTFLKLLIRNVKNESYKMITNINSDRFPCITSASKLLYNIQKRILFQKSLFYILKEYSSIVINESISLIDDIDNFIKSTNSDHLYNIFEGVSYSPLLRIVLQPLLTGISHGTHFCNLSLSKYISNAMCNLVSRLDQFNSQFEKIKEIDDLYTYNLPFKKSIKMILKDEDFVKINGKLTYVIDCPDSELVSIKLKSRPRPNLKLVVKGNENHELTFTSANWPERPFLICGKRIKLSLITEKNNYIDFRCYVSDIHVTNVEYNPYLWLLELESIAANAGCSFAETLSIGRNIYANIKSTLICSKDYFKILKGGLNTNENEDSELIFLKNFINNSGGTNTLYQWIKGNRKIPTHSKLNELIESAEKRILAAIFRHSGLTNECIEIVSKLNNSDNTSLTDLQRKYSFIYQKVTSLISFLIRRSEIMKDWLILVREKNYDKDVLESFQVDIKRLKDLCELRQIDFDEDLNVTMQAINNKLKEEIEKYESNQKDDPNFELPDPYKFIFHPIIEKAEYLLKLLPAFTFEPQDYSCTHLRSVVCNYGLWNPSIINENTYEGSPIRDIFSFITSNTDINDLEHDLHLYRSIPENRVLGFDYFLSLINTCSFNFVRHYILIILNNHLRSSKHYLNLLEFSGKQSYDIVRISYYNYFSNLVSLMKNMKNDPISTLYILRMCVTDHQVFDIQLLSETRILSTLKSTFMNAHKYSKEATEFCIQRQYKKVRHSTWKTIKIIILNCLSWNYTVDIEKFPDVKRFFEEIFVLLCDELTRILQIIDDYNYKDDFILNNELCYDIVFLLHEVTKKFDLLKKIDPSIFLKLLKKNIYQKTKRLSIYLLSLISKYQQNFFSDEKLENILLELGKTLIDGIIENQNGNEKIVFKGSIRDINPQEEYELYLLNLPEIARDKISKLKQLSLKCNIEDLLKKYQSDGCTIIYKGTYNECDTLARDIVKCGCSVKIMKTPLVIDLNENREAIYWVNGYSSFIIASEYIYFFNEIFNSPEFPTSHLNSILTKNIENITSVIDSLISNDYKENIIDLYKVCATLSILSCYIEPIKVGNRVQINSQHFGENTTGIVFTISDIGDIVEVYLENDKLRSLHLFSVNEVRPLKEYNIDKDRIKPFMNNLIPNICYILKNSNYDMDHHSFCLFNLIQSQCLKILYKMTETVEDIRYLLESPLKQVIPILIEKGKSINILNNLQEIENFILDLYTKLWDIQTMPEFIEIKDDDHSILPYNIYKSKTNEIYPYCLDISKTSGVIYNEEELKVEKVIENETIQPRHLSIRIREKSRFDSKNESTIYANTIIPNTDGIFYFEIKIEKFNSSSPIAIGLSKYGSECWKSGCYMFMENKKIVSIDQDNRSILTDYGEYFQTKSVIGCGWNQPDKTIFFTKDGVHLGVAFENVYLNNEQVIPTLFVGKHNIISVNFGQKPFKFNLKLWSENLNQLKLMGFETQSVKQALRLTNNNVESAIVWLIKNKRGDSHEPIIIDDESSLSNNNDISSTPESNYDYTLSSKYILRNCYNFQTKKKFHSSQRDFGKIDLSKEFETHVLPEIRSELLLDDDDPIFVTQNLNNLIKAYMNGGEKETNKMIKRLLGEGLPDLSDEKSNIRISDIRIGMYVVVYSGLKENLPNEFLSPPMERTIGRIGEVKDVDFIRNYVLLEFYNNETSLLERYWYPFSFISISKRKSAIKPKNKDKIMNDLIYSFNCLSSTYCRRIILQLMRHSDLTIGFDNDSNISFEEALLISASEFLSSPKLLTTSNSLLYDSDINKCENNIGMELIASRIISSMSRLRFNPIQMNEFIDNLLSILKKLLTGYKFKPISSKLTYKHNAYQNFKFDDTSAISIVFESQENSFPRNIVIKSEQLEEHIYKYMTRDILYPLVLSGNSFTVKLNVIMTESPPIGLSILPLNYCISLSKWLTEFLMEHTIDNFTNVSDVFNYLLDFIYLQDSPNHIKESFLNLISRFIHLLRMYGRKGIQHLKSLPIHRMSKLINEAQYLYKKESKFLYSTYFQTLLEAIISIMMFQEEERFRNKKSSHGRVSKRDNDKNISLALSLAKSLKEELDEYNNSSVENQYSNESFIDNEMNVEDTDIISEFMMTIESLSIDTSGNIPSHSNDTSSRNRSRMKSSANQGWILEYLQCCQCLELFSSRSSSNFAQNILLSEKIKKAWKKTKEGTLKANILLVEDLPIVNSEYRDSIITIITDFLHDSSITYFPESIFFPTKYGMTQSYMFIEILNDTIWKDVLESRQFKFTIPNVGKFNTLISFRSIGLEGFYPKKRTSSRNQNIFDDQRLIEYLKSKLLIQNSRRITKEFEEVLREIFIEYSVDNTENGVLDKDQLDLLFFNSLGIKANDGLSSNILNTCETKHYRYSLSKKPFIGMSIDHYRSISSSYSYHYNDELESVGLTLGGFIQYFETHALVHPDSVWEQLFNLGYDIHLTKNHFIDVNDAIESILNNPLFNTKRTDEEIIQYAEQIFSELNLEHITMMKSCYLKPVKNSHHLLQKYPRLSKLSLPTLRLRFELLKQFNILLGRVLPLINLEGDGIIAQQLSYCRSLIFLQVKMDFFYKIIDKISHDVNKLPKVTINRLESAHNLIDKSKSNQKNDDFIDSTIFGTAFKYLQKVHPSRLRNKDSAGSWPKICFRVRYKGENVDGESGPYKQFFSDISKELKTVLPLLIPCPNAQAKVGVNRDKYIVSPSFKSVKSDQMYRFLGQLMGVAIRSGVLLSIDFPSFFWKPLVNQELTLDDLRDIDYPFYKFLEYISSCSKEELEGETRIIFEKFEVSLSDKTRVPIKKGGENIDLTYSNREEYRHLAEKVRLNEHSAQMKSIKQGLHDIIPAALFRLFTWRDLELKVCGKTYIDIDLLKRHTEYESCSSQDHHIKLFWKVLRSFSQQDKRAFIRFVSAQERLPLSDEDFIRTKTKMVIKYHEARDPDKCFPKAYTCFFNLKLPKYSSEEIMREKLLFAIHTDSDSLNGDDRMMEIEDNTNLYETISRIRNNFILYD